MKVKFNVIGMTCSSCQSHIDKAVNELKGVNSSNTNLLQNTLTVEFDDNQCSIKEIEKKVASIGYSLSLPNKKTSNEENKKDYELIKLIISFVLLLITMYFSMGNMMWNWPSFKVFDHHYNPLGFALVQFLLNIPIFFMYRRYFISGFKKLIKRQPNMDSLIAIGSSFSMCYGIFAIFMISFGQASLSKIALGESLAHNADYYQNIITTYHNSLFFESGGMILTLVSLGKYLEGLSKKKATKSISTMMNLMPDVAILYKDGEEIEVPISKVQIGDVIVVKKGGSVPVDGVICFGGASLDQATITGESMPVYKKENEEVYSSTVVTNGYIRIKALKVGEDTSIATIVRLVEEASNSKAPISRLADKISGVFVPIILSISLVTLVINMILSKNFEISFNYAVTVIVIACPCALGLATPVAIMVGTGKGAENGLLIKNAEILEKAHLIKTVVFDKTGTITEGKPKVTDFVIFEEDDIAKKAIYSIELKSEHPLAMSIVEYMRNSNVSKIDIDNYCAYEGRGVQGETKNDTYFIGNDKNIVIIEEKQHKIDKLKEEGKTVLIIAKNKKLIGYIGIRDQIKFDSQLAIQNLNKLGIETIMLTGDNDKTAQAIAREIGIDRVISNVLPQEKQNVIESLKKDEKHLVAMVGDGVNDALAITSADLGIAIGGGADITLQSADIVLLKKSLIDVVNVITLSKRVIKTIKVGLFWAFFYNTICVVLATGFLSYAIEGYTMNPMIGALAMSLSSVSVVLNALTINWYKPIKINDESIDEKKGSNTMEITIKVEGMMCAHCKAHVEKAILKEENVISVDADYQTGLVKISYQNNIDIDKIKESVIDAGYEVK